MLVHFPQDESAHRENWHAYGMALVVCMVAKRDPDIEVCKSYIPQEGNIKIHQSRVKLCPTGFPSGYYWYKTHRKSTGHPPKNRDPVSQSVSDHLKMITKVTRPKS